jgi:hypothetical protein
MQAPSAGDTGVHPAAAAAANAGWPPCAPQQRMAVSLLLWSHGRRSCCQKLTREALASQPRRAQRPRSSTADPVPLPQALARVLGKERTVQAQGNGQRSFGPPAATRHRACSSRSSGTQYTHTHTHTHTRPSSPAAGRVAQDGRRMAPMHPLCLQSRGSSCRQLLCSPGLCTHSHKIGADK